MLKFRKSNNSLTAKLSEKENAEIKSVIIVRELISNDLNKAQVTLRALNRDFNAVMNNFAFKHHLNLKKGYELAGEYPNYFIRRIVKKPFIKKEKPEKVEA